MWYLIAFVAKAIQEHGQFPANCFSYDVQPPFLAHTSDDFAQLVLH